MKIRQLLLLGFCILFISACGLFRKPICTNDISEFEYINDLYIESNIAVPTNDITIKYFKSCQITELFGPYKKEGLLEFTLPTIKTPEEWVGEMAEPLKKHRQYPNSVVTIESLYLRVGWGGGMYISLEYNTVDNIYLLNYIWSD